MIYRFPDPWDQQPKLIKVLAWVVLGLYVLLCVTTAISGLY